MPGRVLVVEEQASNRIMLRAALGDATAALDWATTIAEARDIARTLPADMVLVSGTPADGPKMELCRTIKSDPATARVPVLVLVPEGDTVGIIDCLRAGADAALMRPITETLLLAQMRSLKRARIASEELARRDMTARDLGFAEMPAEFPTPLRIATLGNAFPGSALDCGALSRMVGAPIEYAALPTAGGVAETPAADLFVIAHDLPVPGGGLRLMSEIRSRADTRHAAIVMTVPASEPDTAADCLDAGAGDVLRANASADEIILRLAAQVNLKMEADRLRRIVERGLRMAATDALTGLWNRRYALAHLSRIADTAARSGCPWSAALFDVDRFKQVNDSIGHAAGDLVLAEIANRIRLNTRSADLVARIGGEEFLVVFPDASIALAEQIAERIRLRVAALPVSLPNGQSLDVTISAGLAAGGLDPVETLGNADEALLRSKAHGRNRIQIAPRAA